MSTSVSVQPPSISLEFDLYLGLIRKNQVLNQVHKRTIVVYINLNFIRLSRGIAFNFSHYFEGVIWNLKVSDEEEIMMVEVRDQYLRKVRFSALNYRNKKFLWTDKEMEEPWWISLSGITGNVALFTLYIDTNNPDKKAALAYEISEQKPAWWKNDFSIEAVSLNYVRGYSEKFGKQQLVLDARTGDQCDLSLFHVRKNDKVIRPQHYPEGHSYFDTVKTFLNQKFNLLATSALEYLEHDSLIFISCYLREKELANYLFVLSSDGRLLLQEKLGEDLKGIGLDTFFILSGCLIFVRNKAELVSYEIL
jgi:hypothetical protein